MAFFEGLNYAASHEDGRTERQALQLSPATRALCITGSGARVLDLLLAGPAEIVAVDQNPLQNHLLALKLAAICQLSYEDNLAFLGIIPHPDRGQLYRRLRPHLAADPRKAWDRRQRLIRRGVFYGGRWERFLRWMVRPAAQVRERLIDQLFESPDLCTQHRLWRERWDTPGWASYLRLLALRPLWTKLLREPGMAHIPADFDIAGYMRRRLNDAASRILFRTSPWAWLVLRGQLSAMAALPPHLERRHHSTLAEAARRVTPVCASLQRHLEGAAAATFDAFSLSDFGSYADDQTYGATWRAIGRTASPGARFCERQFLVLRDPSLLAGVALERDPALEAHLDLQDDAIVYRILAGRL